MTARVTNAVSATVSTAVAADVHSAMRTGAADAHDGHAHQSGETQIETELINVHRGPEPCVKTQRMKTQLFCIVSRNSLPFIAATKYLNGAGN
jgi:hypothetical protein